MKTLLTLLLTTSMALFSTTYYVNSSTGNDTLGSGTEISPWLTLSKALGAIITGDVIDMTGTFYLDEDPGVNVFVNNGYVIGQNCTCDAVIQGQGADQTFIKACHDGELAESRLFLINIGFSLTLRNISLQNGYDDNGAAIQSRDEVNLENVMISGCNTIANQSGGTILTNGGTVSIVNSTIFDNTAAVKGGALYINAYNEDITVNITNSTLSHNISGTSGGAIHADLITSSETYYSNLYLNINSSTFADNIDQGGNGSFLVYNSVGLNCSYHITLKNSILSNIGTNASGIYSLTRSYTICNDASLPSTGSGNQNNADCLLYVLADNGGSTLTHALMEGSPAVDAIPEWAGDGTFNGAPLLDQRGYARVNANRDIGSYEGSIPYTLSSPELTQYEYSDYIFYLSWNSVNRATGYGVYSSPDPYGTFTLRYVVPSEGNYWDENATLDKCFYYVTAIDSTKGDKEVPRYIYINNP